MDPYKTLGVDKSASDKDIKLAYRELAKQWHPDKNPPERKDECEQTFKTITEAYQILSDPEKKHIYDQYGMAGLDGTQMPGGSPFDIFGQIFRNGGPQRPKKIEPIAVKIEVTLPELYLGTTKEVKYQRAIDCQDCSGTGSKSGVKKQCDVCKGQKVRLQRTGPMVAQVECNACKARGYQIDKSDQCLKCKTQGYVLVEETRTITISKGAHHGEKIVEPDVGHAIRGLIGDLVVILVQEDYDSPESEVGPTGVWERNGDDLYVKFRINLLDALAGFEYPFYHLDGKCLAIHKSDPTPPEQTIRITDKGMPSRNSYLNGNLYLTFEVQFPDELSPEQIEILRKVLDSNRVSIPEDATPVHYTICDPTQNNPDNEANDGPEGMGGQRVQCAQQ